MEKSAAASAFAMGAFLFLVSCSAATEEASRNAVQFLPEPPVDAVAAPVAFSDATAGNVAMDVYLTGYSFWDNTPPGSAAIARPVIHNNASGTGTYRDPITLAVGHTINGNRQTLDFPAGTRFYIERLQKYAIVEDVCGDGHSPQDGPCHTGYNGLPWIDIYVGGKSTGADHSTNCTYQITGVQRVILNPQNGYPVHHGEIAKSGCRTF